MLEKQMFKNAKILVVDDEHSVRWAFERALQKAGYQVALAENGKKGLELFKSFKPEIILVDIRMPEMNGLELLKQIRQFDSETQVIIMTAYVDMETTVQAIKLGAYDFLSKPFDINECLTLINRALSVRRLKSEPEIAAKVSKASALKGNSPAMQEVYKLIAKVSQEDVTVLITGASGSGKELVAQAIHYNSERALKPFWAVSCTAINESLIESELFGYEKGAFTGAQSSKQGLFELASGGTLFLDEIGDMNLEMQAKLLRVLEEREIVRVGGSKQISVDARIIAATNKDLKKAIDENKFRQDLYHRIKVIEIKLPPLRERAEDIPLLAHYFCSLLAESRRGEPKTLADSTIKVLLSYDWPGNVRELKNVINQAYTLSRDHIILPEHLPVEVKGAEPEPKKSLNAISKAVVPPISTDFASPPENDATKENMQAASGEQTVEAVVKQLVAKCNTGRIYAYVTETIEKELLKQSLEANKHNQMQSAQQLGITRNTLRSKIEKYKL